METLQEFAKRILPVVEAAANGEEIEFQYEDGSFDQKAGGDFNKDVNYRIKPKTIIVNGFKVPEPVRENLNRGDGYFVACPADTEYLFESMWDDDSIDDIRLSRGIIHLTKEAAIAHAKAMLGIDPHFEDNK